MDNLNSIPRPPPHSYYHSLAPEGDQAQNPFASETQTLASQNSSDDTSYQSESQYHYGYASTGPSRTPQQVVQRDYDNDYQNSAPPVVPPHRAVPGETSSSSSASSRGPSGSSIPSHLPRNQTLTVTSPNAAALSRNSSSSYIAMTPSEFDRYPHRISSSAAPSIASGSGAPLLRGNGESRMAGAKPGQYRNSTLSDRSGSSGSSMDHDYSQNNPFVVNADFSPFGGYPASSFPLHLDEKEADDYLHNPDPIFDEKYSRKCQKLDKRGWASISALACLVIGAIMLFIVLPVLTFSGVHVGKPTIQLQTVEVLTNYQYPTLGALRTNLVDKDTPTDALTRQAMDGSNWDIVFSDEFNVEGRTFYDGDDQFWTAVDLNYASTVDLEWYDPDAVTTAGGTLVLTLDAFKNHNLGYRSGMVQSWNKFCFTQGILEASVKLPGAGDTPGLWPGVWTLGNLARPGYMATSEGVWPYGYSECDAGITPNQSSTDGISYLPGQKLNACTCQGHDHPNPGTGRGAPEIDAIEGTVGSGSIANGVASQSLQVAPYDIWYLPNYDFIEIHNKSITAMNTYCGGPFQQAISGTTMLNTDWFELDGAQSFQSYGFEYLNDDTDGYIRWFVGHTPSFTLYAPAIGPNGNIGQRQISHEPMSIVMNLGVSNSWTYIDWNALTWPSHMEIDYVRVYQPPGQTSTTCDPTDYPTFDYIQEHLNAYSDVNLTSWAMAGYAFPPNTLTGDCT